MVPRRSDRVCRVQPGLAGVSHGELGSARSDRVRQVSQVSQVSRGQLGSPGLSQGQIPGYARGTRVSEREIERQDRCLGASKLAGVSHG